MLCFPISFHVFLNLLELGSVVQKPFGDLEQDFVQFRHFPCGQLPCCPGQITLGQSRSRYDLPRNSVLASRGVAASRFVGRQDLVAYKGLVLTLGSMITIPMVWSM